MMNWSWGSRLAVVFIAVGSSFGQEPEVIIPQESLDRIHLGYAKVTEGMGRTELRIPASVSPLAYRETKVMAAAGGTVQEVEAELGRHVTRGQAIARILSRDLAEARAALTATEAELEGEHKKLQRTQELVKLGAASREELETVQANHKVHSAHVEEAHERLRLLGGDGTVAAAQDGVVTTRSVNPDQVVSMGQELFTITDLSSVWVEGSLPEISLASVRIGSRAVITTPAFPARVWRSAVEYIEPRVDTQTRSARVRVAVDNHDGALRFGMYMDMVFQAAGGAKVPVVPKAAIQQVRTEQVVYIPVSGQAGHFIERDVKNVKAGDTVVTEGSFLVRAEALRQR